MVKIEDYALPTYKAIAPNFLTEMDRNSNNMTDVHNNIRIVWDQP